MRVGVSYLPGNNESGLYVVPRAFMGSGRRGVVVRLFGSRCGLVCFDFRWVMGGTRGELRQSSRRDASERHFTREERGAPWRTGTVARFVSSAIFVLGIRKYTW